MSGVLPKEAIQFARRMGIDLTGLEPEAEEIWKKLNTLSSEKPDEYLEFVSQQMRESKDAGASDNTYDSNFPLVFSTFH